MSFGARTLWRDLDLTIEPGEFFAVLGPNGSGKTSFLKVLLGLQKLSSGSLEVAGKAVGGKTVG
ncbi:ATP-binding cassette domain-containing protein, partial [Escherichia coli]|nr:ATP-binding cassette domain-containing protein [Escherichia coli]